MPPPNVPYTSSEQYYKLAEEAMLAHIHMIDTELLGFPAHLAKEDIAILAHDTSWHEKSKAVFLSLTLGHGDQWCEDVVYALWFTLQQCLLTVLPFIPPEELVGRMYEIPQARRVAARTIYEFFESYFVHELHEINFDANSDSQACSESCVKSYA